MHLTIGNYPSHRLFRPILASPGCWRLGSAASTWAAQHSVTRCVDVGFSLILFMVAWAWACSGAADATKKGQLTLGPFFQLRPSLTRRPVDTGDSPSHPPPPRHLGLVVNLVHPSTLLRRSVSVSNISPGASSSQLPHCQFSPCPQPE